MTSLDAMDGRAVHVLCSALLRVGFTEPTTSPLPLVRSYRTVSPLPVTGCPTHRRSLSVALVRQVAPTWLSPAPCSVESRLSSTMQHASPRSPGHLTIAESSLGSHPRDTPNSETSGVGRYEIDHGAQIGEPTKPWGILRQLIQNSRRPFDICEEKRDHA
jgi:hypothetical protein